MLSVTNEFEKKKYNIYIYIHIIDFIYIYIVFIDDNFILQYRIIVVNIKL